MFLVRILCLSRDSLYRKLMLIAMDTHREKGQQRIPTPVCDMMKYVNRYGLIGKVEMCINSGTWRMVNSLKREIKAIILRCDEELMKASCLLYRNLSIFKDYVQYKKLNVWWKCVSKSSNSFKSVACVVALLCGTQPRGYGANFGSQRRCQICCCYVVESMHHIIFECTGLQLKRASLINELTKAMPSGMRDSFAKMNNQAKTEFILTGLGSEVYIPEWQDIYLKASRMIHVIYSERAKIYKTHEETMM